MNTHSWVKAAAAAETETSTGRLTLVSRISSWRYVLLLVVLPTMLVAGYYYLFAANQYESEAHFIVSSNDGPSYSSGGFGALLGITGSSQSQSQTMAVPDYLESHAAVSALQRHVDLVAMFRRPEADLLSRLHKENPTPELLLRYYLGKVKVHYDRDTGITTLKVHAFRPSDSYAIISNLLLLGEEQVNRMNERSYRDAVSNAQGQLREAEDKVAEVQTRMTAYRQKGRDIDPEVSGDTQIKLVSGLTAQLASARAALQTMSVTISPSSPQYVALQRQVRALEAEISSQSAQLTGNSQTIASNLGGYEDLKVRQEFAAKQYDAAAASLAKAREDAARQKLYLVRVVDANMPVKSLYPERGVIVLMTFISLCVAYGIGWLILAGVREHAA